MGALTEPYWAKARYGTTHLEVGDNHVTVTIIVITAPHPR